MSLLAFGSCKWCGAEASVWTFGWRGRPLALCRACFAVRCFRRRWGFRVLVLTALVGAIVEEIGRRAP